MRLHLIGLPHTETTRDFSWCAFTTLIRNMATMMTAQGHEVILYAGEENEAECDELVPCHPAVGREPMVPEWTEAYFADMNDRVIRALNSRLGPQDIILLSMGYPQAQIMHAFPTHMCVEYAVGYSGIAAEFRVFPSYAWMHMVYGWRCQENPQAILGQFYDAVIPHFLDTTDWPEGSGGDYLAFVGRLNEDKGLGVACDISRLTGLPLKIAGHGTPPDYGEYLGVLSPKECAELMGGARAVLAPSLYCEPFCLVAVEAQMVGTPVITTDFGAFTETVTTGGYRCHNVREFVLAVELAATLDRRGIRENAIQKYGLEAIGPQYNEYLQDLQTLWGAGFYA